VSIGIKKSNKVNNNTQTPKQASSYIKSIGFAANFPSAVLSARIRRSTSSNRPRLGDHLLHSAPHRPQKIHPIKNGWAVASSKHLRVTSSGTHQVFPVGQQA
jgi:hypothetical protein